MATELSTETICKFNQRGFCKFRSMCRKRHIIEVCQKINCDISGCQLRHPQKCRYFYIYGECKFEDDCAYLHENCRITELKDAVDVLNRKHEVEVQKLTEEIKDLKSVIETLHSYLSSLSTDKQLPQLISLLPLHDLNPSVDDHGLEPTDIIPQFDGCITHIADYSASHSFQCETCGHEFDTEELFDEHETVMQYCCDECQLCFETQIESDLHDLDIHPNDHFSHVNIPESTKLLHAKGQRRR